MSDDANPDFLDLIDCLLASDVDFVVVGAYAVAVHGHQRSTGDLDIYVRPAPDNAPKVIEALRAFGAPIRQHGVTESDFARPGAVYQMGLPPNRIDILTDPTAITFEDAVRNAVVSAFGPYSVRFIGLDALLKNKSATGREKDRIDVRALKQKHKLDED